MRLLSDHPLLFALLVVFLVAGIAAVSAFCGARPNDEGHGP